jgi:hypothetical protein
MEMKRVKIRCTLGIGSHNATQVDEWEEEVPADLSGEELYEWVRENIWDEWIWNFIDGGPEIMEDEES